MQSNWPSSNGEFHVVHVADDHFVQTLLGRLGNFTIQLDAAHLGVLAGLDRFAQTPRGAAHVKHLPGGLRHRSEQLRPGELVVSGSGCWLRRRGGWFGHGLPFHLLNIAKQRFHPVAIGVRRQRGFATGRRNPLALVLVGQIVPDLFNEFIQVAVRHQVLAVMKKFRLAVVGQVVRDQERPAGQGLEHPHVDIAQDAAIEDDPRGGIGRGHLVEVPAADEDVLELSLEKPDGFRAIAGREVADEADVVTLGHVVLAMHFRIAGKR